ncbi:hypothetical protein ABZ605_38060 [Streptomyces sp. NPDC012765]|uniref:hypothetical protein n=1 Tax=Streptomyces sp. NPDC012765 TaxID=3155249 RepID=UPI003411411B
MTTTNLTTTDIATELRDKLDGRLGSREPQITGQPDTLADEVLELLEYAESTGREDAADVFGDGLRALSSAGRSTGAAQDRHLAAARRSLLEAASLLT